RHLSPNSAPRGWAGFASRPRIPSAEFPQPAQGWCAMRTWWSAAALFTLVLLFPYSGSRQQTADPEQLVEQADHLAWLRNWSRAEPLYAQAQRLFAARNDHRNALYAEINTLRGQLPQLPVPEVSQRLAEYLDDPMVQSD